MYVACLPHYVGPILVSQEPVPSGQGELGDQRRMSKPLNHKALTHLVPSSFELSSDRPSQRFTSAQ